jgi:uncharacterized protein YegL
MALGFGAKKKSKDFSESEKSRAKDFGSNRSERLPVAFCLDCSGSMAVCINELNQGVAAFYSAMQSNARARDSVEASVIAFGTTSQVVAEFCGISNATPPVLQANLGGTEFAIGLRHALDTIKDVQLQYKQASVKQFHPWLVFMSDGGVGALNDVEGYDEIAAEIRDLVKAKKLLVYPVAIGEGADVEALKKLGTVLKLGETKDFTELFKWFSASAIATSQSTPGETVPLTNPTKIPDAEGNPWCSIES